MQKPLCVILPQGLQALFMATGLVRTLAATQPVLVSMDKEHIALVRRLFWGIKATFWFGDPDPIARANALGLCTLALPADSKGMYEAARLPLNTMHAAFDVVRDTPKEHALLDSVVREHGPSFVVIWTKPGCSLDATLLPAGVPVVDATPLGKEDPLWLCGVLERALEVHAQDGWFLTLADLLGVSSKKYCHAYCDTLSALACRRKYRRRVVILCQSAK